MTTSFILRVLEPAAGAEAYPAMLVSVAEDGTEGAPVAEGDIPVSLQRPSMPAPLDAAAAWETLATFAGQDRTLIDLGAELTGVLLPTAVAQRILATPAARVVLDLRPAAIRDLPWELLQIDGLPWFSRDAVCRGHALGAPAVEASSQPWPVRMLIVTGTADTAIEIPEELDRIQDALLACDADVDLEILRQPTLAQLRKRLDDLKPHVFHFMGHGRVEESNGAFETYLALDTAGGVERWTFDNIAFDLRAVPDLRLAYVNACRTGTPARNAAWSIGEAFLRGGARAVVCMLADVAGGTAGRVAAAFYAALATGKAVDAAMAAARGAVGNVRVREHYAPCLEVRGAPQHVLAIGAGIPAPHRAQVTAMPDFREVPRWVDRRPERRETWARMAAHPTNLLVVTGEPKIGKSAVARMLMQRCCLCQHHLRYIDMDGRADWSYLDVLRAIRDGIPSLDPSRPTGPLRPLAATAFEAFDRQVDAALGVGREGVASPEPATDASKQASILRPLFNAFASALAEASAARPLVLVFDHVDMMPVEFDILKQHLFDRYVGTASHAVRLALILSNAQFESLGIDRDYFGRYERIVVDGFGVEGLDELFSELLRRNFDMSQANAQVLADPVHTILRNMARHVPSMAPGKMAGLKEILKDSGLTPRTHI